MSRCLCVLALLAMPSWAFAQAHPCDSATPTSLPAVNTGQSFTLNWCHDGLDANGGQSPTLTWRLYRNNAPIDIPTVVKGATSNKDGLVYYTHVRSEDQAGTYTFEIAAINAAGESPRVPFALLPVTDPRPPAVPKPAQRPRIAQS